MPTTPSLSVLVSFNGSNGRSPYAGLIADAAGDLFGTTYGGGASSDGTVFEIAKTASGYASTPTVLVSFSGANGTYPNAGLIADAAGDLFGTTVRGGANGDGTVFELARTGSGYASTPTVLYSFNGGGYGGFPYAGLIADAAGDLFGATYSGGASGYGTVLEIAKTASGYASTPTVLVSFNGTNGANPFASLIADAAGDLFGTTVNGGANLDGTVFELARTASGYASTPTVLVSFNGINGAYPEVGLVADAAGDLFGTTYSGGASGNGTVFEIARTASGFANTPTVLASFSATDGTYPYADLIVDAAGDLFGTTSDGGVTAHGEVFEIGKTASGYASTPTVLVSFNDSNGAYPRARLIADAAGNLFGTTGSGGANTYGSVFEIANSGFQPLALAAPASVAVTQGTPAPVTGLSLSAISAALGSTMTVTVSAGHGLLYATGSGVSGAGSPTLTISGTLATVNAVLATLSVDDLFGGSDTITVAASDAAGGTAAAQTITVSASHPNGPFIVPLANFNPGNGFSPAAGLIIDAAGDLFGTAYGGGASNAGTVFEIARTASGYASTPTVLYSFTGGSDGAYPAANLIADAAGDLFGTTVHLGLGGYGSVFELAKTASGYAGSPNVLASFNSSNGAAPFAGLIADAAGNLFGTTQAGGASGDGEVFEIAKTASGYASTPTVLVSFDNNNGSGPSAGLIVDAAGDLFGTTTTGGAGSYGTVFEIARISSGYASTPTVLYNFTGSNDGGFPSAGLLADTAGNLFGTTLIGGSDGYGTVFEIARTASSYASTPTVLVSFDGSDGASPYAGLIADAAGNLFGSTYGGGASGNGTVFEIAKSASGYASTPTVLFSFTGFNDGASPGGNLVADAAGNLFGTASGGGTSHIGTAFEIANSGFQPIAISAPRQLVLPSKGTYGALSGLTITATAAALSTQVTVTLTDSNGIFTDSAPFITTGIGTTALAITGSLSDVNAALATVRVKEASLGADTITLTASNAAGGSAAPQSTAVAFAGAGGNTYALTTGVDLLTVSQAGDVFTATDGAPSAGDVVSDTANDGVLALSGSGTFDLTQPKTISGVHTLQATEAAGADAQTIFLRKGLAMAVNVAPDPSAAANAGITIVGNADTSVINLASGNDTVTVGGVGETVNGGGGNNQFFLATKLIKATIHGGTGHNTLTLTGGGTAVMGSNIDGIAALDLAASTKFTANATPGMAITGSAAGDDTITLGDTSQSVVGGGPNETVLATVATAGAQVSGLGAGSVLKISGTGTATLNAGTTTNVALLNAATLNLNAQPGLVATASAIGATLNAGDSGQTLTSLKGGDTLAGAAAGGDMFRGTAVGLKGDVIQNFLVADTIDVSDLAPGTFSLIATASGADTLVTLKVGTTTKTSFTLAGSYNQGGFSYGTSDGHSGTFITHS